MVGIIEKVKKDPLIHTFLEELKLHDLKIYQKSLDSADLIGKWIMDSEKVSVLKDSPFLEQTIMGAYLHDIGFLMIPQRIIYEKKKLKKETALIKKHPESGYLRVKKYFSAPIIYHMILQHHEYLDGSGYPFRLKEENISLEAKMIALIDCYLELKDKYPEEIIFELLEMEVITGHLDASLYKDFKDIF